MTKSAGMKLEHIFRQDTDAIQISISEFAQGNQGVSKKLNYSCGLIVRCQIFNCDISKF